jgi:hypothetical protein
VRLHPCRHLLTSLAAAKCVLQPFLQLPAPLTGVSHRPNPNPLLLSPLAPVGATPQVAAGLPSGGHTRTGWATCAHPLRHPQLLCESRGRPGGAATQLTHTGTQPLGCAWGGRGASVCACVCGRGGGAGGQKLCVVGNLGTHRGHLTHAVERKVVGRCCSADLTGLCTPPPSPPCSASALRCPCLQRNHTPQDPTALFGLLTRFFDASWPPASDRRRWMATCQSRTDSHHSPSSWPQGVAGPSPVAVHQEAAARVCVWGGGGGAPGGAPGSMQICWAVVQTLNICPGPPVCAKDSATRSVLVQIVRVNAR